NWVYNLRERTEEGFRNVTLYELDDRFSLVRRIDAETMTPAQQGWELGKATVSTFRGGERLERRQLESLQLDLPERPADFQLRTGRPRHLRLGELLGQIRLRQRLGLEDVGYRSSLCRRVAFPFSALPASLASIALAVRLSRRGHLATSLGEAILLCLLHWPLFTLSEAFGLSAVNSRAISALAPLAILL